MWKGQDFRFAWLYLFFIKWDGVEEELCLFIRQFPFLKTLWQSSFFSLLWWERSDVPCLWLVSMRVFMGSSSARRAEKKKYCSNSFSRRNCPRFHLNTTRDFCLSVWFILTFFRGLFCIVFWWVPFKSIRLIRQSVKGFLTSKTGRFDSDSHHSWDFQVPEIARVVTICHRLLQLIFLTLFIPIFLGFRTICCCTTTLVCLPWRMATAIPAVRTT